MMFCPLAIYWYVAAMRIHVSSDCKAALEAQGGYTFEDAEDVTIKVDNSNHAIMLVMLIIMLIIKTFIYRQIYLNMLEARYTNYN